MIAEIKHDLQECRNAILAFIFVVPLQLLILTEINSAIVLQNVIVLSSSFILIILVFVYTIVKRDSNNKVVILLFLLVILFLLSVTHFVSLHVALYPEYYAALWSQIKMIAISFLKLFAIEYAAYFIISIIGYMYLNKIAMCENVTNYGNKDNKYSAVLIGNNLSNMKNIDTHVGACGLSLLIKHFKNTNKHYQICQKVRKSDFDKFILDVDCKELYILGHGSKKEFKIEKGANNIDYSEYKEKTKHKKRVVAQLHCAKSKIEDESLADILAPNTKNSYVGCGEISILNVWWYCFKMWIKSIPR